MERKYKIIIAVILIIVIAGACFIYMNSSGLIDDDNDNITINNLQLINQSNNNTNSDLYRISYSLSLGKHYNNLECEYFVYTDDYKYIGHGKSDFNNISQGTRTVKADTHLNSNATDSDVPKKIQVRVYKDNKTSSDDVIYNITYDVN